MTPDLKFLFFVGYVDPFSEDRLAVLGFFLNFVRRRRRRRNGQILDLLGFAAGKNRWALHWRRGWQFDVADERIAPGISVGR